MTRKIALIAGLFVFIFMPMQAARKLTKISFDKLTYDFGTIYEKDGNATCTFRFVNEGKTPLVILRAQASCGCTVPSYPEYPIAPGDTAEMKVEYRTRHRPGEFSKYILSTPIPNPIVLLCKSKVWSFPITGVTALSLLLEITGRGNFGHEPFRNNLMLP